MGFLAESLMGQAHDIPMSEPGPNPCVDCLGTPPIKTDQFVYNYYFTCTDTLFFKYTPTFLFSFHCSVSSHT